MQKVTTTETDRRDGDLANPELHNTEPNVALRRHAEEIVYQHEAGVADSSDNLSPEATRTTLHELRVHEIELQMQNEELRRTQIELEAARAQYFDLYDLAPVGYCVVSEQGQIQQANLTATSLFGTHRGALVKQPISRFIFKADQDIYYLCRKNLLATGEAQTCELRMMKHDGTQFWARLAATSAHDQNGTPMLRVTITDVTERVQLRQSLEVANMDLQRANISAEKANLAKSNFLANMSHELRSPLNAILGFAQLLQSDATTQTATQKANTDQILKAGWYLLDLVNEILDLPLVESGQLHLTVESMSLNEVILECQAMMEPVALKHRVAIRFCHFEAPCFVHADRRRVKQIVINLLSNAIKYNHPGGSVVMECAVMAAGARISVKDTGAGLSTEKLAQLFQPFNRLGEENKGEEGTGIGLVMTKRLVELMGGTIGVTSIVGVGSEFWVELVRTLDE
jgi:PAS domain S-box-containing protein